MLKQENFLIVQLSHMEKYGTYDKVKKSLGQLDHCFIIFCRGSILRGQADFIYNQSATAKPDASTINSITEKLCFNRQANNLQSFTYHYQQDQTKVTL